MTEFKSKMAPVLSPDFGDPVAPEITSAAVETSKYGEIYEYTPSATGDDTITWWLIDGPDGMLVDSFSGMVRWGDAELGEHSVVIMASNDAGVYEQEYVLLIIEVAPIITSAPLMLAIAGNTYSYIMEARGTDPFVWSLMQSPDGMEIDSNTGIITMEEPTEGMNYVTVSATNPGGMDSKLYRLVVHALPEIVSSLSDSGSVGIAYRNIPAFLGTIPCTWSLLGAPSGMVVNERTGVIDWSAPIAGFYDFMIHVANEAGSDSFNFSVNIT